jgi:acetyl-CoA acetyltransferase family protein
MPLPDTDGRQPVLVDGCRTPFLRSGTGFADLRPYDLGRIAVKGLLARTGYDPAKLDRVILGTVVHDVDTPNVAREAALAAGVPASVPAYTVSLACISSNQAIADACALIQTGQADAVVAGGTDTLSDPPIRFKRPVRQRLFKAQKARSPADYARLLRGLSPSDLLPDAPSISEFSTGLSMGESAERLAAMFGVSRQEQDEYAVRSHQLAARAWADGHLEDQVLRTALPPAFEPIVRDNGFRADTSVEKLAGLSPSFQKPYGTVTAGNASFLTDGASATLIMSAEAAEAAGHAPLAYLRQWVFTALPPDERLLLAPALAIPRLLDRAGLSIDHIDVWEIHEAFAGQVLAVLRALDSQDFADEHLDGERFGELPVDRINLWGGSLSLGHPFGATGARLVTTAAHRLRQEGGRLAVVAACAAGGHGHAMLIERA